jgi:hypothetical protein
MLALAAFPLWFVGGLLLVLGIFGIFAAGLNDKDTPYFKTASDGAMVWICMGFILASSLPLYIAAKVMS